MPCCEMGCVSVIYSSSVFCSSDRESKAEPYFFQWDQSNKAFGLQWLLLEGVLYIVGALLYAERWPERTHPFKFDFFVGAFRKAG